MFWFLPNTSVRFWSAALGGAVSAMLILFAQDFYLSFSVGVSRANALFGAFAQLPLLLVWIYVFWAIVLFGAELAFAHQNLASYRQEVRGCSAGPAEREAIGLRATLMIARAFDESSPPETADSLTARLETPIRTVREILRQLEAAGNLVATGRICRRRGLSVGPTFVSNSRGRCSDRVARRARTGPRRSRLDCRRSPARGSLCGGCPGAGRADARGTARPDSLA